MRIPFLLPLLLLSVLSAHGQAQQPVPIPGVCTSPPPPVPPSDSLTAYVWTLPSLRCRAILLSDALSDTAATTYSMADAARVQADSLRPVLYRLAAFYQNWGDSTARIVDAALEGRFRWLTFTTQPEGFGRSGTITIVEGAYAAGAAEADMVQDLVFGLCGGDPAFPLAEWTRRWEAAGHSRHEVAE